MPTESPTQSQHSSWHCLCNKRGSYQTLTHLHGCNIHYFEALQVDGAIIIHMAPQLVQDGQHGDIGLACSRGGAQQDVVCSKKSSVANLQEPRAAVRRDSNLNRQVDCPARALLTSSSAELHSLPHRELVHSSLLHSLDTTECEHQAGHPPTYSRQAAVLCWEGPSHQACALVSSECMRQPVWRIVGCAFW